MLLLALLLACADPPPADLPVHTLAFGGDFMLGRGLNRVLDDPAARDGVLGDLALLRTADLALINGEGVITMGGGFVAKGEPSPNTWRARPPVVDLLLAAGIDVVAMGNNHAGDYGPAALREAIQRLRTAGLDAAGAGLNSDDARTPVYRQVGDTIVAFVGVDLTNVRSYRAGRSRPGTLALPGEDAEEQDEVVERLGKIAAEARKHAHVVLLTPHWGPNWRTEPLPAIRDLGRRLLKAGYDGILGHSSHTLQGVEIVDGEPIVYDAGTLALSYSTDDPAHRAILYEVRFTRAGVVGLTAYPLALRANRTRLATGEAAARILGEWAERTAALGTAHALDGESAGIACDPGKVEGPEGAPAPPRRAGGAIEPAPADVFPAELPPDATPADALWPNGVRLVGYHLLAPTVQPDRAAQVLTLYLRAERPLPASTEITLRVTGGGESEGDRHQPGDWLVPADQWPVGRLLADRTLLSFTLPATDEVTFSVGFGEPPAESALPVQDGLVVIAKTPVDPAAPRIAAHLPRPGEETR